MKIDNKLRKWMGKINEAQIFVGLKNRSNNFYV